MGKERVKGRGGRERGEERGRRERGEGRGGRERRGSVCERMKLVDEFANAVLGTYASLFSADITRISISF